MLFLSLLSIFATSSKSHHTTQTLPPPNADSAPNKRSDLKHSTQQQVNDEARLWSIIHRWPATTICLSVTSILCFFLFCFAAAGWPGSEPTSNCYEDYLITPDCFCEKLRGDKPGDAWVAQPMNTVTNLYFVIVGLMIAYASDSKTFPSNLWWQQEPNNKDNTQSSVDNLIVEDNIYAITFGLASCLLGVGSTFLHASFTTWGRQADMTAMYLIGTFMNIYPLLREQYITREQAIWTYIVSNVSLISWLVCFSTPDIARKMFTILMVTSFSMEILLVDPVWAKKNQSARRIFYSNLLMFAVAVLQWKASESGMPLCYPESIFQGHSLWHFQSAVGIGGVFVYYLAEEVSIPMIYQKTNKKVSLRSNTGVWNKKLSTEKRSIVE